MISSRYLVPAATACLFASCSMFNKGEEDYDTVGDPYDVPGEASADAVPYQAVNPPADHPTYSPAAYEESAAAPSAPSAAPSAASTTHTVVRGDTLGGIARRYGVSSASIQQANGMTNDTVVLGRNLIIPGSSGPVASSAPAAGGKTHTVVRGDTLERISRRHGVSIDAIKKANGMSSDTVILGSKLRIP
jgi:LysM repeat protein